MLIQYCAGCLEGKVIIDSEEFEIFRIICHMYCEKGLPLEIQPNYEIYNGSGILKKCLIHLEQVGLIVTTESDKHLIKIMPRGIFLDSNSDIIFCLSRKKYINMI